MEEINITTIRALKILFSWSWRMFVLGIPVMLITFGLMATIVPFPPPGATPEQMKDFPMWKFFIVWLTMMSGMIAAHAYSIKWLLKTKWSDFHLRAHKNS